MSDVESGWRPYPGARQQTEFRLPPVEPGRAVGLGAVCDLRPPGPDPRDQSFAVSEFVTLEDGRRVLLHHEDRGFAGSVRSTGYWKPPDIRWSLTLEQLTSDVLTVVLPDDDDDPEPHPWAWLADLARSRGLDVTAGELRALPYEVVFTDELRGWLASYRGVKLWRDEG